ncbi:unnamed protein product [Aspergillus oryzae]|uniref:Unnamed protein product n=1 Tax=Aspergillus oryzae var. brunneus TaxID=332754 RepID=A0ABQ6KGV3_ASPOZ|nr:unnamed protein product [Aspergillus oryzae]GMF83836.1 unnamed protein product [Aspergillus oryzae]GMG42696.1 unnamed protein product [Aspergillus oryzae var. brunneus]
MYSVTRIFAPNKLEDPVWASSTIATLCGESISNKSLNAGWEDVDMFSDRAVYVQPNDFESLPVKTDIKVLPINDVTIEETPRATAHNDSNFFLPLSRESISSKYKMNLESPEIRKRFSEVNQLTDGNCPALVKIGCWNEEEHLDSIVYQLMWEADVVPRMGTDENSRPLRVVTGWKSSG